MTTDGPAPDHLQGFSAGARRALLLAEREARSLGHEQVGTEHVLLGLLADDGTSAAQALQDAGATVSAVRRKVIEAVGPATPGVVEPAASPRATRAIGRAPRFARDLGSDVVHSDHLLLAVLDVEGTAGQVLRGLGVDIEHLGTALGARTVTATREDHHPPAAVTMQPVCPGCQMRLDASLVGTVVPLSGLADEREVTVVSCPACGHALGVI